MPLGSSSDTASRNWVLDSLYGDNHVDLVADSLDFALFNGDPTGSGTELGPDGGYVRVSIDNISDNFPDAVDGVKTIAGTIQLPLSTAAYSDGADYWALYSAGSLMDSGQILDPGSGDPATVTVDADGEVVRFLGGTLSIAVT